MKVLFISAWYPNRYDAMAGLFVRKHAEAVQLYDDVQVLYVHPNTDSKTFELVEQKSGDLQELIVYYPVRPQSFLYKFLKVVNYLRAYWKGYNVLKNNNFTPDIVHVNILTRTGFMAYLYKKWKGTPYVVTEHWTRYLPQNFAYTGYFRKKLSEEVIRNASAVFPVSIDLMKAMKKQGLNHSCYEIINNVVEEVFFQTTGASARHKKRLLHISCFSEPAKNIKGLLRATWELSKQRADFELVLVGTGADFAAIYDYAQSLHFPANLITFTGEQTPVEVAEWFRQSDVFVLFSNYENAPVVISESLVSGKPVISTNVGGISEQINATNGLLIDARNEQQLTEKMNYMLDHFQEYDTEHIRNEAYAKFCYAQVGKHIHSIYRKIRP